MTSKYKQHHFTKSLSLLLLLYAIYALAILIINTIYPEIELASYKQSSLMSFIKESPLQAFLMILVVGPVLEEMLFRSLLKPSHYDLAYFVSSWPVFIASQYIPNEINPFLRIIFLVILLASMIYIVSQLIPPLKARRIRAWLSKYVSVIWCISSLIFGLFHITNYVTDFIFNIPLLILIMPRVFAGFAFGYLKIKNQKLEWSIALHIINNLIPLLVILFQSTN
ncbi:CPBP family intramembrane glutamic endopeptidase [Leeuwenhoekiella aestuarii]|uniref:CPBP family intramembrane glutamic endopeptidase n=1 Tax=Leeuwenhoekiella aestuarii TaxID=2249426 RepID=UPI000FFEFC88|nr:CPBP family intramembrane glutamic endopeptidase [Leeuwenhoekiella aestuarii]